MLVLHDEIDLPFGDIRARIGGGLAGHNGLKSLEARARLARTSRACGSASTARRRPTPIASPRYVLGRFSEPPADVRELIERAADAAERIVLGELEPEPRRG